MAYYVRKIARAKWEIPGGKDKVLANLRADAIANDLRTTKDTLSFWRAESLKPDDLEPVIVVNSLLSDHFDRMQLLCVPDTYFDIYGFKMSQNEKDADTVIADCRRLHYDLVSLDVKGLLMFASKIVLRILQDPSLSANEKAPDALIRRYTKVEAIALAKQWLEEGKFTYASLEEKNKGKLIEALQKS